MSACYPPDYKPTRLPRPTAESVQELTALRQQVKYVPLDDQGNPLPPFSLGGTLFAFAWGALDLIMFAWMAKCALHWAFGLF